MTRLSEFKSHQSLADRIFGSSILWIPCDVVCGSATPNKHSLLVPRSFTILVDSRQKIVSVSLAPRFTLIRMIQIAKGVHPSHPAVIPRPPSGIPVRRVRSSHVLDILSLDSRALSSFLVASSQASPRYLSPPGSPDQRLSPFPPGVTKTLSLEWAHSGRMIPSSPCQVDGESLNPPPAEPSATVPRDGHCALESAALSALIEIFPDPTSSVSGLVVDANLPIRPSGLFLSTWFTAVI